MKEVLSGRPSGEGYHRSAVVCTSQDADRIMEEWNRQIDKAGIPWLWGPHSYELTTEHGWPRHWNGHELVDAPVLSEHNEAKVLDLGL